MKVAVISDLHLDYDYTPGMNSHCGKPLCCRSDSGLPDKPEHAAGKWGDQNCDMAEITALSMFKEIRENIDPDLVFWAGDSVAHNDETLTLESNVEQLKKVSQMVVDNFSSYGYKVIPAIGNHDTYPMNQFKNFKPKDNKAIEEWAPAWEPFVTDKAALKTWMDYGYFSLPIEVDGKNVGTAISLNSNVCYDMNFDSFIRFQDPGNMLHWFEKQLERLEAEGSQAILVSHVPNKDECLRQYGRRFHALLDKYQHIIRFQITSHTHRQGLNVIRDMVA